MYGVERELARLERDWMEAVRSRDAAFLERLLGEEFTLTTGRPGNEVRGRREYIDITRERYAIEEFAFDACEVHAYGDAAMVRSRYAQRGSMDGEGRDQTFLMTDVFARRDGRWVAVTRHVSPLEPRRSTSEEDSVGIGPYGTGHRRGIRRLLQEIGWEERYVAGQLEMLETLASPGAPAIRGTAFVSSQGGDLLGFVSVEFRAWNRLGYLHGLAVDPERRRRGIASALIRHAEGFVRGEGGRGIHLDTPVNNGTAQVFYRARGYEFAYRMPDYYEDGLDGVTFLKLFRVGAGDVAGRRA